MKKILVIGMLVLSAYSQASTTVATVTKSASGKSSKVNAIAAAMVEITKSCQGLGAIADVYDVKTDEVNSRMVGYSASATVSALCVK